MVLPLLTYLPLASLCCNLGEHEVLCLMPS